MYIIKKYKITIVKMACEYIQKIQRGSSME